MTTGSKPIEGELRQLLGAAERELACPGCMNNPRGVFRSSGGLADWDECRVCRGEHRNGSTIELLRALTKATDTESDR